MNLKKGMCFQCGRLLPVDSKKQLEMCYTAAEFKKTLFGQFSQNSLYQVQTLSNQAFKLVFLDESCSIEVEVKEAPPRKIAMLSLPVLVTTFTFSDCNEEQQAEFFQVFFKYFHKGGG